MLLFDEIQDIVSDAVPVLEQCQSHSSKYLRFNCYAGTPKTTGNLLTRRWKNSCQFEWLTKCEHCSKWNYPDDRIVGLKSYICTHCGKEILPHVHGIWVASKPSLLNVCWGFRMSQLMVPFKEWQDIYDIRENPNNTRQKYFNECLGLPYDEGELVLTETIMQAACTPDGMWSIDQIKEMANRGVPFFGGIDYGTGEGETPAYTVLTIGYRNTANQFKVVWLRKLMGEEANLARQPALIDSFFSRAGVRWAGADWGFGAHNNARMVDEYGWNRYGSDRLVLEYQYGRQKQQATWNGKARRYMIDRNQSMAFFIDAIRKQRVLFFAYDEMDTFLDDFLTIFIEYNETTETYKYDHSLPDDAFHSVNYAYLAMRQFHGMLVPTDMPQVSD
jgi:hypothetical protein